MSVLPLKTVVEKIGGQHVDVHAMVQPGYSPLTYNPTPKQIAALSGAVLYVRTGVPFEDAWMERIRSANREMEVLDARAGMDLRAVQAHTHGHDQVAPSSAASTAGLHAAATESDPHVWTDPALVAQMAGSIRDKLIAFDPGNADNYRRNHDTFVAELEALDSEIRSLLQDLPSRRFMVFHPAWGYFARTYGLIQVPIESEGKEPGPRGLAAVISQAKRAQVKIIFVQPQFSRKFAEQVAHAIGGRVVAIDPLSADYTENLRNVARQIAEAARE